MYLGAKIGILGANGAGKSTLMKILAGVDKDFDGEIHLDDGIKVGYLPQEPPLDDGETVMENIEVGVKAVKADLAEYNDVSMQMAEPDCDMDKLMARMDALQTKLDASDAWEIDRTVSRAMDALRCPPGDALVANLSGGERGASPSAACSSRSPTSCSWTSPRTTSTRRASRGSSSSSRPSPERWWPSRTTATSSTTSRVDPRARPRPRASPFEGNYSPGWSSKSKRSRRRGRSRTRCNARSTRSSSGCAQRQGQQKKGKARLRQYEELCDAANSVHRARGSGLHHDPRGASLGLGGDHREGVSKGYEGRGLLIEGLDCIIPAGAVVGIVGANGAGKTTLFKMITGVDTPDAGTVTGGRDRQADVRGPGPRKPDATKTVFEELSGGAEEISLGSPNRQRARVLLVVQLQELRPAEEGGRLVRRRAQPPDSWRRRSRRAGTC
jgi:ATPase subunit of ABC transporter with duplicated ATPase domains